MRDSVRVILFDPTIWHNIRDELEAVSVALTLGRINLEIHEGEQEYIDRLSKAHDRLWWVMGCLIDAEQGRATTLRRDVTPTTPPPSKPHRGEKEM